jgi:hemoglobin
MSNDKKTLYERLGGYDAIAAVANDLLPRLRADPQLGRFWAHRGEDGVMREKQLLIEFLCASAGGPMYYRGRDMELIHRGTRISDSARAYGSGTRRREGRNLKKARILGD